MKTSWSLIEVSRLTDVSPLLNFFSSTLAGEDPRRSQMASVKRGWEEPEKIWTRLIVDVFYIFQNYRRCLQYYVLCAGMTEVRNQVGVVCLLCELKLIKKSLGIQIR